MTWSPIILDNWQYPSQSHTFSKLSSAAEIHLFGNGGFLDSCRSFQVVIRKMWLLKMQHMLHQGFLHEPQHLNAGPFAWSAVQSE